MAFRCWMKVADDGLDSSVKFKWRVSMDKRVLYEESLYGYSATPKLCQGESD